MFRDRVIDTTTHQVSEYASVHEFVTADSVQPGISTIYEGNLPIDLLVAPAASDTTIFFFHGAIESHFTLPVLSGLGISGGLDANRVFVSDPTLALDEDILLAWYAGNYFQPDLQQQLTCVFRKIVADLNSSRVVFFGGSGGGFASLYFASQFENSLALVFNPQTNIAKYSPRAVNTWLEKGFDIDPQQVNRFDALPNSLIHDMCAHYTAPTRATVAYMQNLKDDSHVQAHLHPFTEAAHPDTELFILTEPWRDGHSPPPKELLSALLNQAVPSDAWSQTLLKFGFKKGQQCS